MALNLLNIQKYKSINSVTMYMLIPSLVIFIFNQKKLMRYVNMRYANMNINIYILYIIVVEHK